MNAYLLISTLAALTCAVLAAWRLYHRPTVDDLVALVFWTALMVWGLILL